MTKKKSKNPCSKCLVRHSPPTGNKCSGLKGAADGAAGNIESDGAGLLKNCKSTSKKIQKQCKQALQAHNSQKGQKSAKDCKTLPSKKKQVSKWEQASLHDMFSSVGASSSDESTDDCLGSPVTYKNFMPPSKKKVMKKRQPLQETSSASSEASSEDEGQQSISTQSSETQSLILAELKKLGKRLDKVESKVEDSQKASSRHLRDNEKLSSSCSSKKLIKHCKIGTCVESSSEEDNVLTVSELRASKRIQKKVDEKLAELEEIPKVKGNEVVKSKRGGAVEVVVKNKISWPHEMILGGPNRQRLTYDQMSLTQFVQGFSKNILEEKDEKNRESMVRYLSELMEDATDFSWSNAKAAHAVLLCDMERGILTWGDTEKIDRIRQAHAQKHQTSKQTWGKSNLDHKKPWFCKQYQTNSCTFGKDHESFGKTQKHVCAFCLSVGKILNHPECDCRLKKANAKNSQAAAQNP